MRNSKERWLFFKHPSKPAISHEETFYWKNNLKKILKVGMEFEFNLPNKNGSCKGDNEACPCNYLNISNCWTQCAKQETCSISKNFNFCHNVTLDCSKTDCKKCNKFKLSCPNISCSLFESACSSCPLFKQDCYTCEHKYDPEKNPDLIRTSIENELKPSNSYGVISESGVHSVVKDGSLLGGKGMEIITIGRRIDYWEFFKMAKTIIDKAVAKGAYVNERCSIHMHVLASYYSRLFENQEQHGIPKKINELEKPMPEIILANFHQLCRRYQNAMTWMMMGLDDPKKMTRWEKFRVSILEISPVLSSMEHVKEAVRVHSGGNKYGWVNYNYTELLPSGNVNRFHVEMRALDGILCPSVIAAIACLYYALAIKAVEISKYGLVEVGSKDWMATALEAKQAILNNMKGYQDGDRWADTRKTLNYRELFVEESLDLIRQLKHILVEIGPAYQVLEQLAERPIAIRRCAGESWASIEETLAVSTRQENNLESLLYEYIDLRYIAECNDIEEWISSALEIIVEENKIEHRSIEELREEIKQQIKGKQDDGEIIWSKKLGTIVVV